MSYLKQLFFSALLLSASLFSIAAQAIDPVYTKRGTDIAIKGYDPVAYFKESKPVKGNEQFSLKHKGAVWWFSSAENRDLFVNAPEKYSPQYGGYCAYAVARNMTASIKPELFVIVDDKLYLNYSKAVNKRFLKDTGKYIAKADQNWPKLLKR